MVRTDIDDLGDYDNIFHHSFRMTVAGFQNPTESEKNISNAYSLINPDDHDKYLVDPAYRLEKHKEIERVYNTLKNVSGQALKYYDE